jgi:transposase-like protein
MKNQRDFDEIKRKFLEEVAKGKAGIAELAKKYGISKPCAYTWVRKNNKLENSKSVEQAVIKEEPMATPQEEIDSIIIEAVVSKRDEFIRVLHDLNQTRGQLMKDIDALNKYLSKK